MATLAHLTRGQWLLIVLSLCLITRLGFALVPTSKAPSGAGDQPSAAEVAPTDLTPVPSSIKPPPLSDFAEIDERPLFVTSRRPSDDSAGTINGASGTFEIAGYLLQGVVESDAGSWALLRRKGQQETLRLSQGETVGGWEIVEIGADYIKLSKEGKGEYLVLREAATP